MINSCQERSFAPRDIEFQRERAEFGKSKSGVVCRYIVHRRRRGIVMFGRPFGERRPGYTYQAVGGYYARPR